MSRLVSSHQDPRRKVTQLGRPSSSDHTKLHDTLAVLDQQLTAKTWPGRDVCRAGWMDGCRVELGEGEGPLRGSDCPATVP